VDEVSRLNRYHETRHHRKNHRWTGLKVVSTSLWVLVVALLLARRFAGNAPYLLPVSIIAWGFSWPLIHASLFRAAAGRFQAEDARGQGNQPTPKPRDGGGLEKSQTLEAVAESRPGIQPQRGDGD
jgi:hypothetical protein